MILGTEQFDNYMEDVRIMSSCTHVAKLTVGLQHTLYFVKFATNSAIIVVVLQLF